MYLIGLYNLPNRIFYPQLRDMDSETLRATVVNVAIYAAMELLSFLVLYVVLKRKLRISAIHQLAFVLDKHRHMVQSKLILWVVFMLQSTLVHLGTSVFSLSSQLHARRPCVMDDHHTHFD